MHLLGIFLYVTPTSYLHKKIQSMIVKLLEVRFSLHLCIPYPSFNYTFIIT